MGFTQLDCFWVIGEENASSPGDDTFGLQILAFDKNHKRTLSFIPKYISFFENVSMCDKNGSLIFVSNGVKIFNKNLELMEGGDELNKGPTQQTYKDIGYPTINGMIALPSPQNMNFTDLIHTELKNPDALGCSVVKLLWTRIDNLANGGLGKVLFKNKVVYPLPLKEGGITACRHANGRDWWLPINPCRRSKMDVYLLDPIGLKLHHSNDLLRPLTPYNSNSVFSPDGKWFVHHSSDTSFSEIHIMEFDRCTGTMSNHQLTTFMDTAQFTTVGAAISPNSKFLYIVSVQKIRQYDLTADDIFASEEIVAEYDGTMDPFPAVFFDAQLAPDGKIYVSGLSPVYSMTVIENPDLKGKACNVNQHSLKLSLLHQFAFPQFPNYRLGAEQGSSCDTLTTSIQNVGKKPSVTCNFNIERKEINLQLSSGYQENTNDVVVFSSSLNKIYEFPLSSYPNASFSVQHWPAGLYIITVRTKFHSPVSMKIIIP